MKWIGVFIVISAGTWIGFDVSKKFQKRVVEIRQFILSLQMLENEMVYSKLPLKQIFENTSKHIAPPTNLFFIDLAKKMESTFTDFGLIWEAQLIHHTASSALKPREIEIINQFGRTLGQHTSTQQEKHIILTIKHLENELNEAIESRMKYEKMSRSIGVLFGIFIVLLLL